MVKAEKSIERKQPNFIMRYYRETVGELKKVNWPSRQEATNLTLIVLAVTFGMSAIMGLLDLIFSRFFGLLFKLGG